MGHSTPNVQPSLRAISGVSPSGSKARGSVAASWRMPAAVTSASVWWSLGSKRRRAGGLPRPFERAVEVGAAAELGSRHAGAAQINASVDFDHRAAVLGQRVHRPDRDLAVEAVEQAHAREAGLGDLGRADRVIGRSRLAAALRIEPRVALAEVHELGFHAVRDAEIEMPAVGGFEEARRAEILVVAALVDIGPEFARGLCGTSGSPGRYSPRSTIGGAKLKSKPNRVGSLAARLSSQSSTSSRDQIWPGRISRGGASPRASAMAMPLWRRPFAPDQSIAT